jgi:hypothetical protein
MGLGLGQGMGQGLGQGMGQSQEQNQAQGSGNRTPDGRLKNAASQLTDQSGQDAFLYLPQRQRDLIRQAMTEGFPPEYSALLQQYYINLARGRLGSKSLFSESKK